MHSLTRTEANLQAAKKLRVGDTADGWTMVRLMPGPWFWVLVRKGDVFGRISPRMFLEARDAT